MHIDRYLYGGDLQVTLTEADVENLVTGLAAALYRDGEGAFGGGAPWKPDKLAELRELRDKLDATFRPRSRD